MVDLQCTNITAQFYIVDQCIITHSCVYISRRLISSIYALNMDAEDADEDMDNDYGW
jgi:hypothetical protein